MNYVLLVLAVLSATVHAADTVNITISGTLTRPPCTMSTASSLTASFGDVQIDKIDETETKTLPIQLRCPAGSSLNVSFAVSEGTHSATIAKTNVANLGVSMLWANNDSTANLQGTAKSFTNLSGSVDMSMKAKLIKLGDLSPGRFTSALVMTINYL
ncbi:fimbrial protein [Pseudomonas parafulva]|uniref:Fimbrial protein n=1 Tax=Pseudomonas parafulva TaxID=157782 RepID=A0AAI8PDP3_9PSED|nr:MULTISPECIES: fimbrial protein [Pseudomonas]AIZ34972.1 fimbrial protein [Pseudomonas parafulva]ATB65499.1 fimbrial protein [Pseudomonas mosselii]AXO90721.1 fimbrial protein [Pseudomonas parafulva]